MSDLQKSDDRSDAAKTKQSSLFDLSLMVQPPQSASTDESLPTIAVVQKMNESNATLSNSFGKLVRGAVGTAEAIATGAGHSVASAYHAFVDAAQSTEDCAVSLYDHRRDIGLAAARGLEGAATHPLETIAQADRFAATVAGDIGNVALFAGSTALEATSRTASWIGNHKAETAVIAGVAAIELLSRGAATPALAAFASMGAAGTIHSLFSITDQLQEHSADIEKLADADTSRVDHDDAFNKIADATGSDAVGLASAVGGFALSKLAGALRVVEPAAKLVDNKKPLSVSIIALHRLSDGTRETVETAADSAHLPLDAVEQAKSIADPNEALDSMAQNDKIAAAADDIAGAKDASGRPLADGNAERVALKHPALSADQLMKERAAVESDLSSHNGALGKTVLEQFKAANMSESQKERVLNTLAEIRHSYHFAGADGTIPAEQLNSYRHTLGELKAGIESSHANQLTSRETQDALLAGMLSDAEKYGWSKSTGGNFFTHHLDGALAADTVLSRQLGEGFDANDIAAVKRAIIEHQITPPKFMGSAYASEIQTGMLAAKIKPTFEDKKAIDHIMQLISNPLEAIAEVDGQGGYRLAFTDVERDLLRKYVGEGAQDWHVPPPANIKIHPLASDLDPVKVAAVTRTADIDDNYNGEVDAAGKAKRGPFKIAGLRGPRQIPPDLTIDQAIQGLRDNMQQNEQFLTEIDKSRLSSPQRKAQVDSVYEQAKARVAQWLSERNGHPPDSDTPYWGRAIAPPKSGATFDDLQAWKATPEAKYADEIQQRFASELYLMRLFY